MKTFKHFIAEGKKPGPTTITSYPVHGKHTVKKSLKPTTITATPIHGKHSVVKKPNNKPIKEDSSMFAGTHHASFEDANPAFHKWAAKNENTHIHKDVEGVHNELHKRQRFADIPHKSAVGDYTSDSSTFNHHLINRAVDLKATKNDPDHDTHERIVNGFTDKMDKNLTTHKTHTDLHVYHGASFNPGKEAAKSSDSLIHLPAYTSTTIHKAASGFFASPTNRRQDDHANDVVDRHVIHFHVPEGHHGLYVGAHSEAGNEHEFTLPRDTIAKIHPKPDIITDTHPKTGNKTNWHIWHARVADDSAYKGAGRKIRTGIGSK